MSNAQSFNPRPPEADPLAQHDLCELDARALQALCEAGFEPENVPVECRDRARRCAALLGLLSSSPAPVLDQTLIHATLVRAAVARRAADPVDLASLDEDALDALVAAGFDAGHCPAGIRARAAKHATTLSVLDVPMSAGERDARVALALKIVQNSIQDGQQRMRLDSAAARPKLSFRWGDLISLAALLLIGSAVIMPMVGAMRSYSRQSGCQTAMGDTGRGFGAYANDFKESLPLASASLAGLPWWDFGHPEHSNSANLYTLARAKYTQMNDLACPGNARACREAPAAGAVDWTCSDAISYSYQNQFSRERESWNSSDTFVVLADRSPVIVRAMRGEWINPNANSDNHAGQGQNVLFSNGVVVWMRTPVLQNGDNIWLPHTLEELVAHMQDPTRAQPLHGDETPAGKRDVFLSP